jgi:O-antigen ligase
MLNAISEFSTKILAFGAFLISVVVITSGLNEPVNAPKMLFLVVTAFALVPLCFTYFQKKHINFQQNKVIIFMLSLLLTFVFWLVISNALSNQPFEHGFYGTYGRNTGTLTYLSLSILLTASIVASLENKSSIVIKGLYFVGISNVVYFIFTLFGIELFKWNNPSKSVLGTFGNSNFAGAFMGIFFVLLVGVLFQTNQSKFTRYLALTLLPITFYEVIKTKATQGLVVCAVGLSVIALYYLRFRVSKLIVAVYAIGVSLIGLISIAGILQIGPLEQYLYKLSVSLRGAYWAAGWQMGLNNPIIGVGPDSYGFYYREFRDQRVIDLVGPSVTTDAAHNVFLDIFAYGGFPLFLTYIVIQLLVIYKILTQFKKARLFDPVFATIVACWFGYQSQSLVSINQIGVAIWGWILGGLILGYNSSGESEEEEVKKSINSRKASKSKKDAPQLVGPRSLLATVGFAALGFVIAIQPLMSDAKYYSALVKRETASIDTAARKWPTNPVRLGDAATLFSNNGFNAQSIDIAKYAIEKYPNSYVSWYVYYTTPGLTTAEKEKALKKLQSFDPLNEELR